MNIFKNNSAKVWIKLKIEIVIKPFKKKTYKTVKILNDVFLCHKKNTICNNILPISKLCHRKCKHKYKLFIAKYLLFYNYLTQK